MEQGSLRCDANVSLAPAGSNVLGTRTETKNVNSLRSVERALRFEIQRQGAVLAGGARVVQETRHWHEDGGYTSPGRNKEQAEDYRYFPEPDLVPIAPSREWVEQLRGTLPLPESSVVGQLHVDRNEPQTVYAAAYSGVFRSTDGTASWQPFFSPTDTSLDGVWWIVNDAITTQ